MAKPVVYILHGDDEYAIKQQVKKLEAALGDPATSQMNIDHFDGNNWNINTIQAATHAMPFISKRRLIIITNPLKSLRSKKERDDLLRLLDTAPSSSMIVLQMEHPLVSWQERKKGKKHWLEIWAEQAGERAYIHEYLQPRGNEMIKWIIKTASEMGGSISHQAAELLASHAVENPRIAVKELEKLLTYVNYQRTIDDADVENLVINQEEGNIFALVDAIGNRDKKMAIHLLRQILEVEDPFLLFGMIVRQFRLIFLIKEALQQGLRRDVEIANAIQERLFVVRRLIPQARNFSPEAIKSIYHQLLTMDSAVKSGQSEWDVALETFVAELTF